ncbi:MAG: cyclic nucleotide-binding domain-containing protein [Deltaproteobacteria bacterium]|nr:cyclic nucleotide-binding domain-containing protein [Deltaproteobacteria bacterium]
MDIDQTQKEQALRKAKELMAEGERQRALVRLSRQVEEFERGNVSVLLQDEFVRNVSQAIVEASREGSDGRAETLIEQLGKHACGEDAKIRERAVMALSFCFSLLSAEENDALLAKAALAMALWLKVETTYLPVCDTVCRQLQQSGLRMMDEGHWQQFDSLLEILFQIQSGVLKKSNVIRGLVARTQDLLAIPYILEELSLVCLHSHGGRQALAEKILVRLGRRAVIFLLEKLLASQQKDERLRLITLIVETGKVAVPVLKEYPTKDLPWYGLRNIVLLIAAMGDSSLVPLVLPLLKHEDIRVQQQILDCINDLAGEDKKRYFLSAFSLVNDDLKAHLIMQLGQLECRECADVLLDILAERETLAAHVCDDILSQLCTVLRLAPQQRTLILLRQLIAEREKQGGSGHDAVTLIARRTLQILEPQLQPTGKKQGDEPQVDKLEDKPAEVSSDADPVAEQQAGHMRGLEAQIQPLLQEKKITEAIALLAEHAVHAAKEKDFVTAEILRDRMLAVNPYALIEVIRVGEAIEEEKRSAISSHHLTLWSELYDFLDTESFSALYHCPQTKDYLAEEIIVQQGDANPTLYFINAGQVALTCRQGKKEIFLKRLNPGEIVGVGPFFDVSLWTVTLTAMTTVQVQALDREAFLGLLPQYPGLESRLSDFCRRSDKVSELLRVAGENRREEVRYPAQQIIVNTLLDGNSKASSQQFKGLVEDISIGGLSLLIRISKKENARLLLGRGIISFLPMAADETRECRGEIVAVTLVDYVEKDYLVHVRFTEPMYAAELQAILFHWRRK